MPLLSDLLFLTIVCSAWKNLENFTVLSVICEVDEVGTEMSMHWRSKVEILFRKVLVMFQGWLISKEQAV